MTRVNPSKSGAIRRRLNVVETPFFPAYVVWELTLRCDHACHHCGSRAVKARPDELTTSEALEVVKSLAKMGAREVVLIGGEAYLHDGFLKIIRALADNDINPVMTTGAMGVTPELAKEMADAGLLRASVSIDGLQETHDLMRNRPGSFEQALKGLKAMKDAGTYIGANTNFNRANVQDLEALYDLFHTHGVKSWQVQITAALGRAADRPQMLFQPYDLIDFLPRLAALKARGLQEGLLIMPGNNLGYYGPEEGLLRSQNARDKDRFRGCQAGRYVMGIESDGAVKGCPSLQTHAYVGGKLREQSLEAIWQDSPELSFTRSRTIDDLWGYCRSCVFAEDCLGGCSFTSHALFGRPGNNPYCHFRARSLAKQGKRERLVLKELAAGLPFDHGRFELIEEPIQTKEPELTPSFEKLIQLPKVER